MNTIKNFLTSLIIASWIGGIAIIAIQNIQPVSLKFLWFESIKITTGLVFAFSVGIGLLLGSIFFTSGAKPRKKVTAKKTTRSKANQARRQESEVNQKPQEKEDWSQKPSENW